MLLRNLRLTMRQRLRFAETKATVALPVNGKQSNVMALSKQKLIKKSMLWLVPLFIFTSVVLKAQSPQKINFQSIVRNTSGVIVSNKSVKFKITILSDSTKGNPVYSETHLKTTDAIGLVSLQIGSGTVSSGVFSSLNWGNASHFIKLEADFTGGNTYVTLGTQELMSVPYAMYAAKTDTASLNLTNRFAEKAPINNPSFTGTVGGITKAMVGLGSVDNTSDANKPVSSATQTALAAKVNTSDTSSMLSKYLRKADFPSGTSVGEVMYWNGSKWVSLSPGTTGQALIMSSTGLSWGCLITNSADTPTTNPTLVVNTALTAPIMIATTGATGIDTIGSGLPNGVTATWSADEITISGTPTAAGSFTYTIPLSGGCGNASATGTITVTTPPACPTPTVEDIDGNIYNTVSIGNQCWTKENLRVSRYNDGTLISVVTSGWGALTTGGRSWYDNDSTAYENPYGNLYNWYAAAGIITPDGTPTNNICPSGWHVPTDAEWTILTDILGGLNVAGGKMKSTGTTYWSSESAGTDNSSGFSALPGGYRGSDDSFSSIRDFAFFWSATENFNFAWIRILYNLTGSVVRANYFYNGLKSVGASVRCLRD